MIVTIAICMEYVTIAMWMESVAIHNVIDQHMPCDVNPTTLSKMVHINVLCISELVSWVRESDVTSVGRNSVLRKILKDGLLDCVTCLEDIRSTSIQRLSIATRVQDTFMPP